VFVGDRELEMREFPDPSLGPGEVTVQIRASDTCGSNLHTYHLPRPELLAIRLGDCGSGALQRDRCVERCLGVLKQSSNVDSQRPNETQLLQHPVECASLLRVLRNRKGGPKRTRGTQEIVVALFEFDDLAGGGQKIPYRP
jgi:hypothetical protein